MKTRSWASRWFPISLKYPIIRLAQAMSIRQSKVVDALPLFVGARPSTSIRLRAATGRPFVKRSAGPISA
jgi:hypothetical protein